MQSRQRRYCCCCCQQQNVAENKEQGKENEWSSQIQIK
jgi:hypothetical protein